MFAYFFADIRFRFRYLKHAFRRSARYMFTRRVVSFLRDSSSAGSALTETERMEFINYLSCRLIDVFNYPFVQKYRYRRVKIYRDSGNKLRYVMTDENRRLYFKRDMKAKHIRQLYNSLCWEQDVQSPHNYCFNGLSVGADSIFADIGAAEGIFTLKFIDGIRKAYLFEYDSGWIEALHATFSPWKDRVEIVGKYVSDRNDESNISLDSYFQHREKPTLLKIDVEGAEKEVLNGANALLEAGIADVLVCTYHLHGDEAKLTDLLREKDYHTVTSSGYMMFFDSTPKYSPDRKIDFRRGLIHASR